ncbi:MAG: alpha/beta hydrolase [Gemmatimonadota bacterium]
MTGVLGGIATITLAVALLTGARRRRERRRGEAAWRAAHPIAADGIVPGAAAIDLEGGARAALLLHGFGDTPQALRRQARALHERGWKVRAPLLPGHGRTLEAFRASDAVAWTEAVRAEYLALATRHREVALVGLSMGGALAVRLAAEERPPSSLVLLAPFLEVSVHARVWTTLWPLWSLWRAWVPSDPAASIRDPVARGESLGYGCSSPRLLRELRRVVDGASAVGERVGVPTLAIYSTADYRVARDSARRAFARLGATEKELRWVERSGHVISVDCDAEEVTCLMVEWLERHVSPESDERLG